MTARLTSIEIEAFRGFADTQRFDLDADVVLMRGDNGAGKTSLIDGLLWLLRVFVFAHNGWILRLSYCRPDCVSFRHKACVLIV